MLHLLHPVFVHVSLAFLAIGGVCEAWGMASRKERPRAFGAALVLVGTISLVGTVATGFLAANVVDLPPAASVTLARHETTGLVILATFLVALFWKGWCGGEIPARQRAVYAALLLLGVGVVAYGGFLGGELVYGFGVGVLPP